MPTRAPPPLSRDLLQYALGFVARDRLEFAGGDVAGKLAHSLEVDREVAERYILAILPVIREDLN